MDLRTWAAKLMETKPFKLVAVAIANKLARIAFALMRDGSIYGNAWPDSLRPAPVRLSVDIGGDHVVM